MKEIWLTSFTMVATNWTSYIGTAIRGKPQILENLWGP